MARLGRWARWASWVMFQAGLARTCFRLSPWSPRSETCWSSTGKRVAGSRWRCSRARAMGRSSTPRSAGATSSSAFWPRWRCRRRSRHPPLCRDTRRTPSPVCRERMANASPLAGRAGERPSPQPSPLAGRGRLCEHVFVSQPSAEAIELGLNTADPATLVIDLNCAFASIEQQRDPELRGRVLAIAAYATDAATIVSSSRAARDPGLKTGMRVFEAKALSPGVLVREPDPPLYRKASDKLIEILQ